MSTDAFDWAEAKPISELKVSEIETLCQEALLLERELKEVEEKLDVKKEKLTGLKRQIQTNLDYFGKDGWDSSYGKVEIRKKTSVKTPKTEDEKRALFDWLRERGIFWQTVSVNSQTLNALFKAEFEASTNGVVIPGIGEPEIYATVILKPKR